MKKLFLLAAVALSAAACAPQMGQREMSPERENSVKAVVARETASACSRHLRLVRGGGYEQGISSSRINANPELLARVRADIKERVETGYCERARDNLAAGRYSNPYLRAI